MATRLSESRVDHCGQPLPKGVYALVNPGGEVVSYENRSREAHDDSLARQRLESVSPRKLGSLDRARGAAINHRESALEIVRADNAVLHSEKAARRTVGKLFNEWIALH